MTTYFVDFYLRQNYLKYSYFVFTFGCDRTLEHIADKKENKKYGKRKYHELAARIASDTRSTSKHSESSNSNKKYEYHNFSALHYTALHLHKYSME